ncbi:MAG: SWIM zinc finger family protein [Anaerolineae bacterium]|nr:SWIM zinc finger family protein [Anaerolineae bacterium]
MAKRRRSYYSDYWPRYETTRPIDVEDGIKAKSKRGKFVENWWADRWIEALKHLMDSGRLSRGRSYARRGQVIEINVKGSHVSARVQGSRRTPYKVSIDLKPLTDNQWAEVFDALAEQAIFAAQLLNGEMPAEIDRVFATAKVPLFPAARGDLETDCSCPDWANPCKHIAAVYYLLGERFDEDPFLMFELRGRNKDEIVAALRERRVQGVGAADEMAYAPETVESVEVAGLEDCLDCYWQLGSEAAELTLRIAAPEVDMALLKRMGVPPIQGIETRGFWAQMERVYDGVTERALELAFEDALAAEEASDK